MTLEGKTINLEVQVIAANLNYNLLLGRSWTLVMFCIVSMLFRMLCFPHEWKIVTVVQITFFSSSSSNGNMPYVGNTDIPYESIRAGLFKDSAFMGKFSLPPPNVASINMISTSHNPWIVPHLDQVDSFGNVIPLSPLEQAYQAIVLASAVTSEIHATLSMHLDVYSQSLWLGS